MTQLTDTDPTIPVLPEVQQNLASPREPVTGRVVSSTICTAKKKAAGWVRHVSIDVSGTPLAGNFRSGQSFGVLPPGEDDRGRPHKLRLYSIASPTKGEDGNGQVLATTCKRLIDEHWDTNELFTGVASNYLCDLKEGDEVQVTGPSGKRFILPEDPSKHDFVFFSTGTGIAPFRGMLADLIDQGLPSKVTVISGSPYATDLLYHQDFIDLDQQHENFRYITAVSREKQEDGHDRMYVQDRIMLDPARGTDQGLHDHLQSDRTLVYICGIAGMEIGIFQKLAESLPEEALAGYLNIDDTIREDPTAWTRRMINRQLKPTRRVFLEVY